MEASLDLFSRILDSIKERVFEVIQLPGAITKQAKIVYRHLCPNCGGPNTDARLARGLPCPRCLPRIPGGKVTWRKIANLLKKNGRLASSFEDLVRLDSEAGELLRFFESAVGSPPWGAQRTWAKRLVRRDSFSIIAPTGVGKTTFGAAASLYYACRKGEKSYIVVPTTTLAANIGKKLQSMIESTRCGNVRLVLIHSKMKTREKREALEAFENGHFDILVTTAAFARKYVDKLSRVGFRIVFVDDVDAVLKSTRSVDAILKIVGFNDKDIEMGLELLRLQRMMANVISKIQRGREKPGEDEEKKRDEGKQQVAELRAMIDNLRKRLEEARKGAASLIVSSATGRPRGARVRLFRVLLDFEAGGRSDIGLRRVIDTYQEIEKPSSLEDQVVNLVRALGGGGLVFVPLDKGVEYAEELASRLKSAGVEAEAFHAKKPLTILDRFASGEIEVLVGVANYYGTLVRGLDLPERVRYAIFAGVPRHKFGSDIGDPHPSRLLRLLGVLAESPIEEVSREARHHMGRLRRIIRMLSPAALQTLAERVAEGRVESSFDRQIYEAFNFLRTTLSRQDVWSSLSKLDVGIVREGGKTYLLVPDPATYLQASGRTSRLYAGGITLGLSIVLVDYEPVMRGLMKRTSWMADIKWTKLEDLDLEAIIRKIDEDRERVRRVVRGMYKGVELVRTSLLVVESPNKARTIARFFGQPSIRILPGGTRVYEVATGDKILMITASGGHVFDLVIRSSDSDREVASLIPPENEIFGVLQYRNGGASYTPIYTTIKRCLECGHQFVDESSSCPRCGSTLIKNSADTISDIRRLAWEADEVYIGTDPDTEGEKIGWDVGLALKPYNSNIRRLEFHEVTKKAIQEALSSPREFNTNLVDAQVVRRVEDRWIGFTLSPLLWCDFWRNYYCPKVLEEVGERQRHIDKGNCSRYDAFYNLSAGRVQTPTLGWIVDRTLLFRKKIKEYRIVYDSQVLFTIRSDDESIPHSVVRYLKDRARHHQKTGIEPYLDIKVKVRNEEWASLPPQPPYTTDALLRDADRYLRIPPTDAMRLAQDLFEWGLITYHRTDSTRVSDKGIATAREWLSLKFGEHAENLFRPRRWGEGGAHEAIRPVRPLDVERLQILIEEGALEIAGVLTRRHLRLYDLIFRRFMASQMREAEALKITYRLEVPELDNYTVDIERLVAVGRPEDSSGVSKGFTLVWPFVRPQPPIIVGRESWIKASISSQTVPKAFPYTLGEVVEEMKRRGIGRPSTYAKIVETLDRRRYIMRLEGVRASSMIVATSRGIHVYKYLTEYLKDASPDFYGETFARILMRVPKLVSEERTRELERQMDLVEAGEKRRDEVIDTVFDEIGELALLLNIDDTKNYREVLRGNTWASSFTSCALRSPDMKRLAGEVAAR